MALGVPMVLSDLGPLREVAAESATYVRPDNVSGFADAIVRILAGEQSASKRSALGRWRFDAHFTAEKSAYEMASLYKVVGRRVAATC